MNSTKFSVKFLRIQLFGTLAASLLFTVYLFRIFSSKGLGGMDVFLISVWGIAALLMIVLYGKNKGKDAITILDDRIEHAFGWRKFVIPLKDVNEIRREKDTVVVVGNNGKELAKFADNTYADLSIFKICGKYKELS